MIRRTRPVQLQTGVQWHPVQSQVRLENDKGLIFHVRIGINGLLLTGQQGYRQTGISRYIERLISALPAAMPDAEILVYAGNDVSLPLGLNGRYTPIPVTNPAIRIGWEMAALPLLTRLNRLGLFHGTVNALPMGLGCPAVVTIHDLALFRWPEQVPRRRYHYLSRAIRSAVKSADRVLAVSEATKADIVELLGVDPRKIAVTPLGVDERFTPPTADRLATFRGQPEMNVPYLLTVGTLEPRKNLPRLLEAFAELKDEIPHRLVLVGPEGWRTGAMQDALTRLDLGDRVHFTGFVRDEQLPLWYAGADVVVVPSIYEGFGLPVVEAMACGAVVVTSNVSSLPEVAGGAALLIDPSSSGSIAEGIRRILDDSGLRIDLRKKGTLRAREFTWQRTAEATVAAYREVLA